MIFGLNQFEPMFHTWDTVYLSDFWPFQYILAFFYVLIGSCRVDFLPYGLMHLTSLMCSLLQWCHSKMVLNAKTCKAKYMSIKWVLSPLCTFLMCPMLLETLNNKNPLYGMWVWEGTVFYG